MRINNLRGIPQPVHLGIISYIWCGLRNLSLNSKLSVSFVLPNLK